jgi:tetratricopeptide (TPR) repeat protein
MSLCASIDRFAGYLYRWQILQSFLLESCMNMRLVLIAATMLSSSSLYAQSASAAEHIVLGDRDRTAMNAASALRHYQEAIRIDPSNAVALWSASREAIDLGEFNDSGRDSLYRLGEQFARRAVQADPKSSMAHFALAKAIGRRALSLGARERVKFAGEVRKEAMESLQLDSTNAGALHVMGMWHANVMRLSGVARFLAKNLLGGKVFEQANWKDAAAFLERASAVEPDRIVHHLDLAGVYRDREDKVKAREQYQLALKLKPAEYNDKSYQQQAERELKELR